MHSKLPNRLSKHSVGRLAPASIEVITRNADEPAIAAYVPTMVPVANAVLDAINDLGFLRGRQLAQIAASFERTAALNGLMLAWTGRLQRDLPGFELSAYTRDASLTFDVVEAACRLRRLVEQHGAALPYQATLLAELTTRIDAASQAAAAANLARVVLQEKQRRVRELTTTFYQELVSLRRTLRAVLGSSHLDYLRLRASPRPASEPSVEADSEPTTGPDEPETDRA